MSSINKKDNNTEAKNWIDYCDEEEDIFESPKKKSPKVSPKTSPVKEDFILEEKPLSKKETNPRESFDLDSIKSEIANLNRTSVYVNLFNLDYNTKESDIRDFYKSINLAYVDMKQISKGVADIVLNSKEDAVKLVEIGRGRLLKREFYLRLSFKNERPENKYHEKRNKREERNTKTYKESSNFGYEEYDDYEEKDNKQYKTYTKYGESSNINNFGDKKSYDQRNYEKKTGSGYNDYKNESQQGVSYSSKKERYDKKKKNYEKSNIDVSYKNRLESEPNPVKNYQEYEKVHILKDSKINPFGAARPRDERLYVKPNGELLNKKENQSPKLSNDGVANQAIKDEEKQPELPNKTNEIPRLETKTENSLTNLKQEKPVKILPSAVEMTKNVMETKEQAIQTAAEDTEHNKSISNVSKIPETIPKNNLADELKKDFVKILRKPEVSEKIISDNKGKIEENIIETAEKKEIKDEETNLKEKIYYKSSNIAKYQEPSYTRKPKKYDNSNYEKIHYKSSKYEDNEYFEQDHYTYRSNNYKSYDNPVISSNNKTYEKKKVYPAYGQYRKEYPERGEIQYESTTRIFIKKENIKESETLNKPNPTLTKNASKQDVPPKKDAVRKRGSNTNNIFDLLDEDK